MNKLSTKQVVILSAVGLLLLSTSAFIAIRRSRNNKKVEQINDIIDGETKDPSNNGGGQVVLKSSEYELLPNGTFPIKLGAKNKKIFDLQKNANANYGTSLDVDGAYGDATYNFMCDKVWSSYYKIGECYEYNNPLSDRRYIRQEDFDEVKNHKYGS